VRPLRTRALTSLFVFALVVAALVIVPSLPLLYWQGWLYVVVTNVCFLVITLDVLHRDPALLERRLKAARARRPIPRRRSSRA
jgi:peptidoglycan/LPS O-acetylase OafA/YrhL